MANALFDAYREDCLDSSAPGLTSVDVVVIGVDHADDTPVVATDDFLDDILSGARVGSWGPLSSKTISAGVFDAADVTDSSQSGDQYESLVIYNNTPAGESAKNLIAYIDTATGLPFTPSGGNVTISWQATSPNIFKL